MVGPDDGAEQLQGAAGERAAVLEAAADQLGDRHELAAVPEGRLHVEAVVDVPGEDHAAAQPELVDHQPHEVAQPLQVGVPRLEVDLVGIDLVDQELLASLLQLKAIDRGCGHQDRRPRGAHARPADELAHAAQLGIAEQPGGAALAVEGALGAAAGTSRAAGSAPATGRAGRSSVRAGRRA
jgi:hypothetical protein